MMRRTVQTLALCAALFPALLPATASAQHTTDESHLGFKFRVPKGWEELPTKPTESYIIARYKHPRGFRGFEAAIEVMRFERPNPKAKETEGELPEGLPEGLPPEVRERIAAAGMGFGSNKVTSYLEWLERYRPQATLGKPKSFRLKKRHPKGFNIDAKVYTGKAESGYTIGGRSMGDFVMFVGVYTLDTHEYAIEMSLHEGQLRKDRQLLIRTLQSMQFTEEAVELVAKTKTKWEEALKPKPTPTPGDLADGGEKKPSGEDYDRAESAETRRKKAFKESLDRAKRDFETIPGWWYEVSPTERYIVVTNIDKNLAKNRMRVKSVLRCVEAMRELYEEHFPPRNEITAVSIIRICKDRTTYHQYGGPGGSAGYWYSPDKELVLYFEGQRDFTMAVLRHEAFHQYIFYSSGDLSPHSWFNEGYGDYYAGAVVRGSNVRGVRPFKWRVGPIKEAIRRGTYVPLEKIVRYSQAEYYAKPDLCYSQGWSFVYFLCEGLPKGHEWTKILPTYFEELQQTGDKDKAVEKAFKGMDFEALEAAWKEFTISGKPVR